MSILIRTSQQLDDLDKLGVDEEYYDTNELYNKLIEYIKDRLFEDKDFHKIIYYYLVDTYKLSGTEICLCYLTRCVRI